MKELSKTTELFTESIIREMTRICDDACGYNLSQGFPDFASPKELKQAAIKAINDELNQYPVTFGEPELREAISQKALSFNKIECDPESDITVTCGATEAMIATLKAIVNPGDEIIIFEPFYENYGPDGILSGAKPRYVKLHPPKEGDFIWEIDTKELEEAFNDKTKAIIINTPNNPTGKVFSVEELKLISDLCNKWDVYAITDEIYEHIIYDGFEHISIGSFENMKDRTITINSISKTYSVTGWRVGWAIANKKITDRIRKVHDFLTVGAPTPFQHAAVTGLNLPNEYYVELNNRYLIARQHLMETLQSSGFKPYLPQGSYYIITDISDMMPMFKVDNDFDFARKLIELTGVACVPGFSFYSNPIDGKKQLRFTFCKKIETLEIVRSRFQKAFNS